MIFLGLTSIRKPNEGFKPVAVIELFTSEGCSSCPPADKLLAKTLTSWQAGQANVFALAFHVDYWNRLGWRDSFSTSQFSARQGLYVSEMHLNGAYTPQMIVNGTTEFVGSDKSALDNAVLKALNTKQQAEFINLTASSNGNSLVVNYGLNGSFNGCQVHFALVTLHAVTSVKSGENGGHVLEHTNVVRELLSYPAASSGKAVFNNCRAYDLRNTGVVAFVQQQNGLHIIAGAMARPGN